MNRKDPSTAQLIADLRSDDKHKLSDAERLLFYKFFDDLTSIVKKYQYANYLQRRTELEGIAKSAIYVFLDDPRETIQNRGDLWIFLRGVARKKYRDALKKHIIAGKRSVGQESSMDGMDPDRSTPLLDRGKRPSRRSKLTGPYRRKLPTGNTIELSLDTLALLKREVMTDVMQDALEFVEKLKSPLQKVAIGRLLLMNDKDIGDKMGVSDRHVRRVGDQIKAMWQAAQH